MNGEPVRLTLARRRRPPRVLAGHPWAYRSELAECPPAPPGAVADLYAGTRFLGRGTYNPESEIAFRRFTDEEEPLDRDFFVRRLSAARDLRAAAGLLEEPCRLVFSEADGLPGFVLDRYGEVGVLQIGTAGAERFREVFLDALDAVFPGLAIYERSDTPSRAREGLSPRTGPVRGDPPGVVEVSFDGIPVEVDIARGQKTGAYLDARAMRRHLRANAGGATVLDAFAHIGLFSRYAAAGGARAIVAIETDAAAAAAIRRALPEAEVREENAFDLLRAFAREGRRFDRIVLDPPPFTKRARAVEGAIRGYKEINLRALRILAPGGILYTSSCSYHLDRATFLSVLRAAAADARREVRVVASFSADLDHPVLLSFPESDYFKGFALACR